MRRGLAFALLALGSACSGDDCVQNLDAACTPAYTPTFEAVHSRTLVPSCAVAGGSCHATAGRQAGLSLEDIDTAYDTLVNEGRVTADDAACSLVVRRIESTGTDVMPPGNPLRESERCAIEAWIRNGAPR